MFSPIEMYKNICAYYIIYIIIHYHEEKYCSKTILIYHNSSSNITRTNTKYIIYYSTLKYGLQQQ